MFTLSSKADYGLVLLSYLVKHGNRSPIPLKSIAASQKLPLKYLSNICTRLSKAGLLGTKEGMGGGVFLIKKPSEITIGDIILAVEGQVGHTRCLHSPGSCPAESVCNIKPVWGDLQKELIGTLNKKTLADLIV